MARKEIGNYEGTLVFHGKTKTDATGERVSCRGWRISREYAFGGDTTLEAGQ